MCFELPEFILSNLLVSTGFEVVTETGLDSVGNSQVCDSENELCSVGTVLGSVGKLPVSGWVRKIPGLSR